MHMRVWDTPCMPACQQLVVFGAAEFGMQGCWACAGNTSALATSTPSSSVVAVACVATDAAPCCCRFYIHCDGALFGMMMPFIKEAPMVSFKKPIGSVSVSGHKFVGAPVPCGVTITRMRYVMALSSDVEYLNSRDATIMGSRNGHAPIYLWYTLTLKGYEGIRQDVERCMRNAHILKVGLRWWCLLDVCCNREFAEFLACIADGSVRPVLRGSCCIMVAREPCRMTFHAVVVMGSCDVRSQAADAVSRICATSTRCRCGSAAKLCA